MIEAKVEKVKMLKRGGARMCVLRFIPVLLHDTTIHFLRAHLAPTSIARDSRFAVRAVRICDQVQGRDQGRRFLSYITPLPSC